MNIYWKVYWFLNNFILRTILGKLLVKKYGYCPQHGWGMKVERYRMNTAYVEHEMNYANGCELCQKETNEYWDERWKEYYSNVL